MPSPDCLRRGIPSIRQVTFRNLFYYIERSVLLENTCTPLVNLIQNYAQDLSSIFSISSLASEDIKDVISCFFMVV